MKYGFGRQLNILSAILVVINHLQILLLNMENVNGTEKLTRVTHLLESELNVLNY